MPARRLIVIDPLARMFKAVVLGLGLLAVLLPPARREIPQPGEFYALMLFALTGLLLTTGTNHLLFLFVALELASLSLYLLAGFPRTARAAEASLKYFLFGGVSAAFLLFGLSLIYGFSHAATLTGVAAALGAGPPSALAIAGLVMVVAGLGFKLAAAPFHYWAPDVYQGAPATSVALVAAASKAVGMVVLVRFLMIGFHAACRRFRRLGWHACRLVAVAGGPGGRVDGVRERAGAGPDQRAALARLLGGGQHRISASGHERQWHGRRRRRLVLCHRLRLGDPRRAGRDRRRRARSRQ